MRFSHQQLSLWYGTADAPAPLDNTVQPRRGVSVTVAVQPASPCNTVSVRYRVDEGLFQSVRAARLQTDSLQCIDYFRATFPKFWTGERVSYVPILMCAGRVVPDPTTTTTFPSAFRLAEETPGG